jgi:riboflavin biosynthesis pyrimidine reductase
VAPIVFSQLVPASAPVEASEMIESLELDPAGHPDRPYVVVNFVASADGRATFDGRSGAFGDDGDKAVFHALRERVDAVLAGTTTMRVENYGRILGKAERRERRLAAGRTAEPLACTVSRSGRLPLQVPLFAEPEAEVVVFCPAAPTDDSIRASVHWEPFDGQTPMATVMETLKRSYAVESVLCEGGPTLFSALLGEGLVDELFLTVAPKLTGGGDPKPITGGPPLPDLAQLELRWALQRESTLYLRYAVNS